MLGAIASAGRPVAALPPVYLKAARAKLRACIASKAQRLEALAANDAEYRRAKDTWSAGNEVEQAAEKALADIKEELRRNGADWRNSPRALEAERALRDAEAARQRNFGAMRDVEVARRPIEQVIRSADSNIAIAVSEVIRGCPTLDALLAEADERRRALEETSGILDLIEGHFGMAGIPGRAGPVGMYHGAEATARVQAWRDAIAEMHVTADAPFPA